ncbi:helix-turn-helix domain-containing protein [Deinococcus altitudinis]|uniref:helix-turn-helix domain-containing protein n=1 Tax=Deinococcus altitudinis TaxID=468914 RepID=UPI00389179F0
MAEKSPWELGALLKGYIKASGKTQRQIADEAGMPMPTYLSQMANGKVNWVRSDYFPALVRVLGLKEEDVRFLRPEAVIEIPKSIASPEQARPLTLQEMINNFSTQALIDVPLPEGLVKAIEEYGSNPKYAGLNRENVQRQLSLARFYDGRGPQTAVEWLTYYLSVKDWIEE